MSYYWFKRKEILQKAKVLFRKQRSNKGKVKKNNIKACKKKKKTRLKSIKGKDISN